MRPYGTLQVKTYKTWRKMRPEDCLVSEHDLAGVLMLAKILAQVRA